MSHLILPCACAARGTDFNAIFRDVGSHYVFEAMHPVRPTKPAGGPAGHEMHGDGSSPEKAPKQKAIGGRSLDWTGGTDCPACDKRGWIFCPGCSRFVCSGRSPSSDRFSCTAACGVEGTLGKGDQEQMINAAEQRRISYDEVKRLGYEPVRQVAPELLHRLKW